MDIESTLIKTFTTPQISCAPDFSCPGHFAVSGRQSKTRTSGLAYTTLLRYMTLLEATFLVQFLPSWSANLGHRLVKSPKLLVSDTGLAASLLGVTAERLSENGTLLGGLLETFVAMELRKAAGRSTEAV